MAEFAENATNLQFAAAVFLPRSAQLQGCTAQAGGFRQFAAFLFCNYSIPPSKIPLHFGYKSAETPARPALHIRKKSVILYLIFLLSRRYGL
jgi:hypothetical protein